MVKGLYIWLAGRPAGWVAFSKLFNFNETWYPYVFEPPKNESEVSFAKFQKGGPLGGGGGGNLKIFKNFIYAPILMKLGI